MNIVSMGPDEEAGQIAHLDGVGLLGGLQQAPLVSGLNAFSKAWGMDAVWDDFQTRSQRCMSSFHFSTSSFSLWLLSRSVKHP